MMKAISAAGGAVCAAGDDGVVCLYLPSAPPLPGAGPLRHHLAARPRIFGAHVYSPSLTYLVGERGDVWRWQGRAWEALRPCTAADLVAVAVAAPGDILVGTADGCVWRMDGQGRAVSFAELRPQARERRPVRAVAALLARGPGEIWAAAGDVVFRMAGQRQAERWDLPAGAGVVALAGAGEGAVIAAGAGGAWRLYPSGGAAQLSREAHSGVTCGPDGTVFATAGQELRELHRGAWRTLFKARGPLGGLAHDSGALWFIGPGGVFRHQPHQEQLHQALQPRPPVVSRFADLVGRAHATRKAGPVALGGHKPIASCAVTDRLACDPGQPAGESARSMGGATE